MFYEMASHFIQMRKHYLDEQDRNIFSDTIFIEFGHKCIGKTVNPKIVKDELYKQNKVFKYTPGKTSFNADRWNFDNSSGNRINHKKNWQILFADNDPHISNAEITAARKLGKQIN
jgi:hypothetical protein